MSRRDRPRAEPPATITAVSAGGRRVDFPDAPITIREGDRLAVAVADGGDIAIAINAAAPQREPVQAGDTYDPSKVTLRFGDTVIPLADLSPRKIPAAVPSGAVWNGIRRAWLVPGPAGVLVVADPQPPPPERSFTTGAPTADVPPSVKISA